MKLEMTLREALEIQTKQVAHYLRHNPRLPEIVAAKTDVSGVDLDTPLDIFEINRRVPRGASIEFMLGLNFAD